MKNLIILLLLTTSSFIGFSQIPAGYYDNAAGLNGDALRLALFNIIKNHNSVSYNSVWTSFNTTDKKPGTNLIWDMYSDNPTGANAFDYIYFTDKSNGNHQSEGNGGYNREHSMPQSWFNEDMPLRTDLFHVYPTDGYVNNARGNLSFGEVGSSNYTSGNGSKRGTCNYPGYSGSGTNPQVFEPIDEYKGDFARSYFYMLTRYRFQTFVSDNNGSNDMVVGNGGVNVSQFTPWAKKMLLEWAANDPVSQKEIDRNNAIYQIQNNRNPYIDHIGYAEQAFGEPSSLSNFENLLTKVWYSNNTLNIYSTINTTTTLVIYNMLGEQVSSQLINDKNSTINIDLPNGIYLASLNNNQSNTLKFVVN